VSSSQTTVGTAIQFTIVVSNKTNAPVTISQITDTLPQGFVAESCISDHGGSCSAPPTSGGQVKWPVDQGGYTVMLQPGERMQLTIKGTFATVPANNQACNKDYAVSWTGGSDVSGKQACVTVQ
jgi:uncharacterized repeat protein (TIGR01451 family)